MVIEITDSFILPCRFFLFLILTASILIASLCAIRHRVKWLAMTLYFCCIALGSASLFMAAKSNSGVSIYCDICNDLLSIKKINFKSANSTINNIKT